MMDEGREINVISNQQEPLWHTKDGRLLSPSDMTTQHIRNALAMLKRKGFVGPSTVSHYLSCQMPAGEMAQVVFEQECDYVLDAPVSEFVDIFENILEERLKAQE